MHGANSQNDTATARWADRSAFSDSLREPVNRQITMMLARPSMTEPIAPTEERDAVRLHTSEQVQLTFLDRILGCPIWSTESRGTAAGTGCRPVPPRRW